MEKNLKIKISIDKKTGNLKVIGSEFNDLDKKVNRSSKSVVSLKTTLTQLATGAIGIYAINAALSTTVNHFIELENAQIGVKKTTGLSGEEFDKLTTSLDNMSVTMSGFELGGLYDIAEASGQLGIKGVEDISEFTRVIAMIGLTTELSAGEAGIHFAKLSKQLGEPISNVETLASVYNELSNTTAATVSDLLMFSNRLTGTGKTIGLTTPEIAGLSAGLVELGINFEVGGSAISRTFMLMASDSKKFSDAMNIDADSFSAMVREEPIEALNMLLGTMETLNASDSINLLKKVGLGGIESAGVLLKLSNSTQTLTDTLKIANDEYLVGTSMQNEYATAAQGLQAQNTMLSSSFKLLGSDIGEYFKEPILEASAALSNLINGVRDFINESEKPNKFTLIKEIEDAGRELDIMESRLDQVSKSEDTFWNKTFGTTKEEATKDLTSDINEQKEELEELIEKFNKYYTVKGTPPKIEEVNLGNIKTGGGTDKTPDMPNYPEMQTHMKLYYKHLSDEEEKRLQKDREAHESRNALAAMSYQIWEENENKKLNLQAQFLDVVTSDTDKINDKYMEMYEASESYFSEDQMQTFFDKWNDELDGINDKNQANLGNQLDAYSSLAGSISNMYEEGSHSARNFALIQQGLAVASGVNAILTQAAGDPYTAFARMAAMSISVVSLLSNIGQTISGSGGSDISAPDTRVTEATTFSDFNIAVNYKTSFDNFIEGLDGVTDKLEDFGNDGTAKTSTIETLQNQVSVQKARADEIEKELLTGEFRNNLYFDPKELSTVNSNIIKYTDELNAYLTENIGELLSFEGLNLGELKDVSGFGDLEGISSISEFNEAYAEISSELNDIAVEYKQLQADGATQYVLDSFIANSEASNLMTDELYKWKANNEESFDIMMDIIEESEKNIATWTQRNETVEETAQRLSNTLGVDLVQSTYELDALATTLIGSNGELTSAELEVLQANEAYLDSLGLVEESVVSVAETEEIIANEKLALEDRLFNLTATNLELRDKELSLVAESNRSALESIYAKEDSIAISNERLSLEDRLFNLTATNLELREKELSLVDESNRSALESIYAKEDEIEATAIQKSLYESQTSMLTDLKLFADDLLYNELGATYGFSNSANLLDTSIVAFTDKLAADEDTSLEFANIKKYSVDALEYSKTQALTTADYMYDTAVMTNKLNELADLSSEMTLTDVVSELKDLKEKVSELLESTKEVVENTEVSRYA